jgi:hypothetical protein
VNRRQNPSTSTSKARPIASDGCTREKNTGKNARVIAAAGSAVPLRANFSHVLWVTVFVEYETAFMKRWTYRGFQKGWWLVYTDRIKQKTAVVKFVTELIDIGQYTEL